MRSISSVTTALAFVAAFVVATPAAAIVETFATFSALSPAFNLRYASSGNSGTRTTDATIFSVTGQGNSAPPATTLVRFSFLQPALAAYVTNVTAAFTLNAAVAANSPAVPSSNVPGTPFAQPNISGSMSFLTTSAITVGAPNFNPFVYAAGSNLLTVTTFSGADITGSIAATAGSLAAATTSGDTIVFTSDFLDFSNTVSRDFALALTSVLPGFNERTGANKALNNFRANVGGQFSSDPAPLLNGIVVVPEPGVWGMLVIGFGLVGYQSRRRKSTVVAA